MVVTMIVHPRPIQTKDAGPTGSPSDEPNNQPHAKAAYQPLREKFISPRQVHDRALPNEVNPSG
jgi:hypothetical protein